MRLFIHIFNEKNMDRHFDLLLTNYKRFYNTEPLRYKALTQAGSNRNYYRFFDNSGTVIGVYSENVAETETFLYYSEVFAKLNLNIPNIYHVSEDKKCYFIQDFGDQSLLSIVEKETKESGFNDHIIELYKKSISALVEIQIKPDSLIDFSKAYSIGEFDKQSILFDLNYFKYYFLNVSGVSYDEKLLAEDFEGLADFLDRTGDKHFMFRDFQGRNILIKDDKPYFIDYQGGRRGAIHYDLASLLYQAKAKVPENIKTDLLDYYLKEVSKYLVTDKVKFTEQFYYYSYLRVLQTLGAYGRRGLIEKKAHFLESIPFAINNLKLLLENQPVLYKYKELNRVLLELVKSKQFDLKKYDSFTINVMSFSYKKGLPNDPTGNGGGFIFDCRGILNPGRFPEYKSLTGRDREVIAFFENNTDIDIFIKDIIKLITPTIENYIDRNFNSLMLCFGCTGGQHRSVYCAENVFEYLKKNYNINLVLTHRELKIDKEVSIKEQQY